MDEKREKLLEFLFGSANGEGTTPQAQSAAQLRAWARAQEKAEKINETLDDPQRSAQSLREMMRDS